MSGDPPNAPMRDRHGENDRKATIRASVLESLKNAEENGYGGELRAMSIDDVVLDLMWYSDMEDFTAEEIKPVVQEWLDSIT